MTDRTRTKVGCLGLVAMLVALAAGPAAAQPAPSTTWPDLEPSNTHYDDIIELATDGILVGRADGTFGPDAYVLRGQVASVLAAVSGLDTALPAVPSFTDTAGSTHEAGIEALAELGVIDGFPSGRFGPMLWITRGQLASILARWLELDPVAHGPFLDIEPGNIHLGAINALAEAGVVSGTTPTTFAPYDPVPRDQFAALINRAR